MRGAPAMEAGPLERTPMPRNPLKRFPTAMLRRGLAHIHPAARGSGPSPATRRPDGLVEDIPPAGPSAPARENPTPSSETWPA